MLKKYVSILLCLVFFFSLTGTFYAVGENELPFTDVKEGHWSYKPIKYVYENGIMIGVSDTLFGGSIHITRGMFAVVITKVARAETGDKYVTSFPDVEPGRYYTAAINWVNENGLMVGNNLGKFEPDSPITRQDAFLVIRKLGGFLGYDVGYCDDTILKTYYDSGSISKYARSAMAWAVDYGLCSGFDEALRPKDGITRAEAAAVLYRFSGYDSAAYAEPPVIHKVKFVNYDDSTLFEIYVKDGGKAIYRLEAPKKPADVRYVYTFTGWDKPLSPITADTTVKAQFKASDRLYKVKFVNWDGSLLYSANVKYGGTAVYQGSTPLRPEDDDYTYEFSGWDKPLTNITADTVITAQYTATEKGRRIDPSKPMIALTFDDGPGSGSSTILDTLEAYDSVATVFELGQNVLKNPSIIRREAALGCEVGNHSYSHPNFRNMTAAQIRSEVESTNEAIKSVLGYAPELMRPPYGATNDNINSIINMKIILWSIDTNDWKYRDADYVYNYVMNNAYDGAIVLMHSIHPTTAQAVKRIVPGLIAKGYQLVTVSELAKYKGYTMENGKKYYQFKNK